MQVHFILAQNNYQHLYHHFFLSRELGYDGGQYTKESHFGKVSDDFMMDDVKCKGTEEKLLDCPHTTEDNCEGNEGLGVICIPNHTTIQGFVYFLLICYSLIFRHASVSNTYPGQSVRPSVSLLVGHNTYGFPFYQHL